LVFFVFFCLFVCLLLGCFAFVFVEICDFSTHHLEAKTIEAFGGFFS